MLEKELRAALLRFAESLVVLLAFSVMYVADKLVLKTGLDYASLIQTAFVITIILFAAYAGSTIFQAERKDHAFEYLFSLPLGRGRILLAKVLPRLGLLVLLGVGASLVLGHAIRQALGIAAVVIFLSALFLSIGVSSLIIGAFGILMLYLIFLEGGVVAGYLLKRLEPGLHGWLAGLAPQLVSASVLLIPLGIAFWLTFREMDARPIKLQMRTYYAIVLPALAVIVTILIVFFKTARMGS
jgi:hypothetical protein